jgi:hypothetical protein
MLIALGIKLAHHTRRAELQIITHHGRAERITRVTFDGNKVICWTLGDNVTDSWPCIFTDFDALLDAVIGGAAR